MMVRCYWCISILIIIPTIRCCSLTGPLCGWSAVVLSDHRYPSFRNFDSTISIDVSLYIGETGRAMQDRIKEHDRDIRLAHTQTSAVLEHANETGHLPIWKEVKFIDRDPHWYTRRVKEAIHIRLHPNNINRDSGIKIPKAWIPTIRKHNSRPTTKWTCEGATSNGRNNNKDRNAPVAANHHATDSDT